MTDSIGEMSSGHKSKYEESAKAATLSETSQDILSQHADEHLPSFPNVRLGIVVPAYWEFSNGNISQMLEVASTTNQPQAEIGFLFVINNPHLGSVLAGEDNPIDFEEQKIASRYELDDPVKTNRIVKAYKENQATIHLLQKLSLYNQGLTTQSLEEIWQQTKDEYPDIWKSKEIPRGIKLAARKNINIAVVDCSSGHKASLYKDIGLARRVGLHIAFDKVFPNTEMVHMADADTYPPAQFIQAVLDVSSKEHPDVITIPQYTVPRTLPENVAISEKVINLDPKMAAPLIPTILYYSRLYSHFGNYANNVASLGGSQLVISRKTYERHEYPNGSSLEDYEFARIVLNDSSLRIVNAEGPKFTLRLNHRGRQESMDGRLINTQDNVYDIEGARTLVEKEQVNFLQTYLEEWVQRMNNADSETLAFLEQAVNDSQQLVIKDRHNFLRQANIVLNILEKNGLPKSELEYVGYPSIFPGRVREFFEANRGLLNTFVQEFSARGLKTHSEMLQFLETCIPEYFSHPPPEAAHMNYASELEYLQQNGRIRYPFTIRDFYPVFLALSASTARLENQDQTSLSI